MISDQPKKPLPPPDVLGAELKALVEEKFPGTLTEDMAQDVQDVILTHVARYDLPDSSHFSQMIADWRAAKGADH